MGSNPLAGGTNQQDRNIGSGIGTVAGGIVGSIFPVVGTALGAFAGGQLGGAIGSEFGPQKISSGGSSSVGGSLNPFGGGGSSSSSGNISRLGNISNQQQSQATDVFGQGQNIYGPAYGQYTSGIAGQLTPAQQALVTQNLGAMDVQTGDVYGDLGLPGSTMETQDKTSNALRSLAEESNINFQNESLGLQGLQTADQYYGTSNQGLSGAATSQAEAGRLANENQQMLNQAIGSLGNKSSSGLGGGISSILGGATGTSGTGGFLSSLFGGGSGAAASGASGAIGGGDLLGGAGVGSGAIGGADLLAAAA